VLLPLDPLHHSLNILLQLQYFLEKVSEPTCCS
jgi:hypothetical protein